VGKRYNMHGMRLLLRVDDESICSVPPQWTDAVEPDPEIVLGKYRSLARVSDFVGLAELTSQLVLEKAKARGRKLNDAAYVRSKMPQQAPSRGRIWPMVASFMRLVRRVALDRKVGPGVIVDTPKGKEARCQPSRSAATQKRSPSFRRAR
jgi:hypothetical protein